MHKLPIVKKYVERRKSDVNVKQTEGMRSIKCQT